MPTNLQIPPDRDARERIVHDLSRSLLVEAAAGTGKTTSMVGRMVALLAEGKCEVSEIAAITFTKKAAAELRDRFQVALFHAARETEGGGGESQRRLAEAAAHLDRGFVGTIHSFCARLLRERPVEAGVDVSFRELDEAEDALLRKRAWDDHVAALFADNHSILEDLSRLGLSIGQLKRSFLKIADYPDVPDWPTTRVDPPDLEPLVKKIREYAGRMTEVAGHFTDPTVSDEMAEEYKLIPKLIHVLDLGDPVDVMRLLRRFKKSLKPGQAKWVQLTAEYYDKKQVKDEGIHWGDFVDKTAEPALRQWREHLYPKALEAIRSALSRYDRLRLTSGRLNYQDLLMKAATLLKEHPQVRRYFARRFTHLLVDEFQDTDPIQAEVMLLLTATDPDETDWTACKPAPGSLFVVGDPKQSIYRFRRADIVTYNQVKAIVRKSGGEVVTLSTNFRTLEPITSWVNEIFEGPFDEASEKHSPRYVAFQPGRSGAGSGAWPDVSKIFLTVKGRKIAPLIEADADRIARTIRRAIDTGSSIPRTPSELERRVDSAARPGDFMILTRTKKHLSDYARKLEEYAIPHLVTGGAGASQTEEILILKTLVAVLARPDNPIALVALLRGPLFGFDDETLFRYRNAKGSFDFTEGVPRDMDPDWAASFQEVFDRLNLYRRWFHSNPFLAALERMVDHLGLAVRSLSGEEGNLAAGSLLKTIEYLRGARTSISSLTDLLEVLENLIEGGGDLDGTPARPDPGCVVRVMNLHKAKGLEAPVVFLADPTGGRERKAEIHVDRAPDGTRGFLLIQEKKDNSFNSITLAEPRDWGGWAEEEQRFLDAEENRLLYVAATRAGTNLVVSEKVGTSGSGAWTFFKKPLEDCPELPDPGPLTPSCVEAEPLSLKDFESFLETNASRWAIVREPSYKTEAAKRIESNLLTDHPTHADRGMDWGTLIHVLLEIAMKDPAADLTSLAAETIEEMNLDPEWSKEALEVVTQVQASEIWGRASASPKRFVEVPFQILRNETLIRGVIDLAFREEKGWVLVDYKTDRVKDTKSGIDALKEKYHLQLANYQEAWERITGEPVIEKFLFSTRLGRSVPLTD